VYQAGGIALRRGQVWRRLRVACRRRLGEQRADLGLHGVEVRIEGRAAAARDHVEDRVSPDLLDVDIGLRQGLGRACALPEPGVQVRTGHRERRGEP